jgi:predicted dehydrogenase
MKIGILGAAKIAPRAIVDPARKLAGVAIEAVAARQLEKAKDFAQRHGIPRAYGSYEELIRDPGLDAVYIALPNSHHHAWVLQALQQGKHVLCEKPLACNATEARQMSAAAQTAGKLLWEAFHWQHHPLAEEVRSVLESGQLGELRQVEASLCVPNFFFNDIRYQYELGGGALMDVGCYPVHFLRTLLKKEPTVVSAVCAVQKNQVDRWIRAELDFGGVPGRVHASMWSSTLFKPSARFVGSRGTMDVFSPYSPHEWNWLRIRRGRWPALGKRIPGEPTYVGQLRAFAQAVSKGPPYPPAQDAVANMRVIDQIYEKAGLKLRGQAPVV